jgi:hypothetical protein
MYADNKVQTLETSCVNGCHMLVELYSTQQDVTNQSWLRYKSQLF